MLSSPAVKFNPHLFESVDSFQIVEALTGHPMDTWNLGDKLEALGLPYNVRDPIDTDTYRLVIDMVDAAFYAGYLVGRDPDKLLLSNIGSPFLSDRDLPESE